MDHSSGNLEICSDRYYQVCADFIIDLLFMNVKYDAFLKLSITDKGELIVYHLLGKQS